MKIDDYRQLRAFIAAVAPLGLVSVGCSSAVGSFDDKVCLQDQATFGELSPEDGSEFAAVRRAFETFDESEPEPQVAVSWGEACATASDPAACQSELAALPMSDPPLRRVSGQLSTLYDLAFTRGDEVGAIGPAADLLSMLGTIDTPSEALLVAFAEGHSVSCAEDNWRQEGDAFVLLGTSGSGCGEGHDRVEYEITVAPSGQVTEGERDVVQKGDANCAIGRRPDGLCSATGRARSLGAFFAGAAHLEAASVHAFAQLAGELTAHKAPRALVRAAWRARGDEIRHARATAALARRFGAAPVRPVVNRRRVRPLFEVAYDNGTEGCVRETFGALIARTQARQARNASVRRALGPIARDETRHAVLSWAIDGWIQSKLSPGQRRTIAAGRREAVATLRAETAQGWSEAIARGAGMPSPEAGMGLLAGVDSALWQTA